MHACTQCTLHNCTSPQNYEKFVVSRDGQTVKRFKSAFDPIEFESDIRLLLAGKPVLPEECIVHPGRKVCKVEQYLSA